MIVDNSLKNKHKSRLNNEIIFSGPDLKSERSVTLSYNLSHNTDKIPTVIFFPFVSNKSHINF